MGPVGLSLFKIELKKLVNGTSTTFASKPFTVSAGTSYTVRLEVIGRAEPGGSEVSWHFYGHAQSTSNV
jgi:hypothetical protein